LGKARANFLAQLSYVVVTLGLGLPLTIRFQLSGVLWGSFAAILATLLLGGYALWRVTGTDGSEPARLPHETADGGGPASRVAA
jgi:hypothetical protein